MKNATMNWNGRRWDVIISDEGPHTDGTVQIVFPLDDFIKTPAVRQVIKLAQEDKPTAKASSRG